GLAVHEHVVGAVLVEVGHLALVDDRGVDLGPGVERAVDDLTSEHVLQLGTHERAALAGLDVLELHDVPEHAVEVERHAILKVVRRRHGGQCIQGQSVFGYSATTSSSRGDRVSSRIPSAVTTTVSSTRT